MKNKNSSFGPLSLCSQVINSAASADSLAICVTVWLRKLRPSGSPSPLAAVEKYP